MSSLNQHPMLAQALTLGILLLGWPSPVGAQDSARVLLITDDSPAPDLADALRMELGPGAEVQTGSLPETETGLRRAADIQRLTREGDFQAAVFFDGSIIRVLGRDGIAIRHAPVTDTDARTLSMVAKSLLDELLGASAEVGHVPRGPLPSPESDSTSVEETPQATEDPELSDPPEALHSPSERARSRWKLRTEIHGSLEERGPRAGLGLGLDFRAVSEFRIGLVSRLSSDFEVGPRLDLGTRLSFALNTPVQFLFGAELALTYGEVPVRGLDCGLEGCFEVTRALDRWAWLVGAVFGVAYRGPPTIGIEFRTGVWQPDQDLQGFGDLAVTVEFDL